MEERYIVFGTGAVGIALSKTLHASGRQVRFVDLSGEKSPADPSLTAPPFESLSAKPEDAVFASTLCLGAKVIYFCPSEYEWGKAVSFWLTWQKALLEIAMTTQARLVVLENAKALGLGGEVKITSATLPNPQTPFGEALAELSSQAQAAAADGRAQIVLGRAGELFGPWSHRDPLGMSIFEPATKGKKIAMPANADQPHSLGYVPDLARALLVLGERQHMPERLWILPSAPAPTLRQLLAEIALQVGQEITLETISKTKRRMAGFLSPTLRVASDMLERFEEPWVLDSRPIERAFGLQGTPLEVAVGETLKWFETTLQVGGQGKAAKANVSTKSTKRPTTPVQF